MPKLNEYLGSIISSVSTARVMADVQTVKVAEDYAKHDLLQHFSVPRMRLDDVEITIPVAVDQSYSPETKTKEPVDIIDNGDFNSAVYKEITKSLGLSSLPRSASSEVRSVLSKDTQALESSINKTNDLSAVSDFSKHISEKVDSIVNEKKLIKPKASFSREDLEKRISTVAHEQIKKVAPPVELGELQVITESHLLREQNPENIMQIKMKISEDGMEWQSMDNGDGGITRKLLPE